ncbi:MAG: TraB/GumN family protein [Candidatus Thorarchaeota archaeon]|nr:TraB/GumN family protein [Candidatus Thorarchaeota archaeon]
MAKEIERVVFVPVIHTDPDSVETARQTVLENRPDVVAVELDRMRYHQLTNPEQYENLEPNMESGHSVNDLMNQIALLEKNLGQETGAKAGMEMLAAIEAGREVEAKIALVDRPIDRTAQALAQVPLDEIYRLANLIPEATEDIEDGKGGNLMDFLKEDGAVEDLLSNFRKEFPVLATVLIEQRDAFIAQAILSIMNDVAGKIVAILGAGHIEGVKAQLNSLLEKDSAT